MKVTKTVINVVVDDARRYCCSKALRALFVDQRCNDAHRYSQIINVARGVTTRIVIPAPKG